MMLASWMTRCFKNNFAKVKKRERSVQRNEVASLRATVDRVLEEFGAFRPDYEALVDAARMVAEERDACGSRGAELESANRRLVDMLWGRQSERRSESPDQQHLIRRRPRRATPRGTAGDHHRPGPGG